MSEHRLQRLQVVSDLHLECYQHRAQVTAALERSTPPVENASACVLAGDIAVPTGRRRRWLQLALEFFSARFPIVFYVPGNHEFYRAPAPQALERIREIVAQHPRVTILEPGVIARWADHRVVGGTLWFREGPKNQRLAGMLSDFSEIGGFVPWVYEQNRAHMAWLNEVVREGDIVVTHHLPSPRSVPETYTGDPTNGGSRRSGYTGTPISRAATQSVQRRCSAIRAGTRARRTRDSIKGGGRSSRLFGTSSAHRVVS